MIQVEGYKAFHGSMKIKPRNPKLPSIFIRDTDWLYKPDTNCWYGRGRSFGADICIVIKEDK